VYADGFFAEGEKRSGLAGEVPEISHIIVDTCVSRWYVSFSGLSGSHNL